MARLLSVACAIAAFLGSLSGARGAEIALAIVYDTSSSMRDAVRDIAGRGAPKYTIGNRALLALIQRLEDFKVNNAGHLTAGLVVFDERSAREAVRLGRCDTAELRIWAKSFTTPHGPTPLGPAIKVASDALINNGAPKRHVLVITDGENTAGPDPAAVIADLKARGEEIAFHFIAFDLNADAFRSIQELGATVVSAADEEELNRQVRFILEEKILLEK
jgi:hypothetical protein